MYSQISLEMVIDKSGPFDTHAALALLITFHDHNQDLIKDCCYSNVHVRHLEFSKFLFLANCSKLY